MCSQHKRYPQDQNDDREPRNAFFQDLAQDLNEWTLLGDHIITCGDANESVFHSSITEFLEPYNPRNLIFTTHDPSNAPRTYCRTTSGRIIDGLWGSPSIQVAQCGYSDPSASPGGHSLLWADITLSSAIGHAPEAPEIPTIRRPRLDNSKIVRRYLTEHSSLVKKNHLLHWQKRLDESITPGQPLTPNQANLADGIDVLKTRYMLKAEKKCRKLRMGKVDFSEDTEKPRRQATFWSIAIRRRLNIPVSSRLWRRLKQKAAMHQSIQSMSLDDLRQAQTKALKEYRLAKKHHKQHRKKFLTQIVPQRQTTPPAS